jgi:hypothetical protein
MEKIDRTIKEFNDLWLFYIKAAHLRKKLRGKYLSAHSGIRVSKPKKVKITGTFIRAPHASCLGTRPTTIT